MKKTAIIVNCARGGIVEETALYEALKTNRIAGAGLDVFVEEPIPTDSPFKELDNVILSTHTAGITFEGRSRLVKMAFESVIDIFEGRTPKIGLINPDFVNHLK